MSSTSVLLGCAAYEPKPLPEQPALRTDAAALREAVVADGGASDHRFDPSDGLDATELATAAVVTNPMLRAARAQRGVAQAQLYAAGLLPDPQLTASLEAPQPGGPNLVDAYAFGVASDLLASLITRGARRAAARQALSQVNLDLLWQEWQVAQQARTLHANLYFLGRRIAAVRTMLQRFEQRYARSSKALRRGDLTLDVTGTDLTAVLDTAAQLSQLQQTQAQQRQDLAVLLGLAPDADIRLAPPDAYTSIPADAAKERVADVARRRPDLLALQAGYASQEAQVREAILGQFPAITVGVNRARDTGDVRTVGFSIGLNLPLLSANRGPIAIARATRAQLRAEYQARLAELPSTVTRLLATRRILQSQQALLDRHLPELRRIVERTRAAYERGDIDALTVLNLENTRLNRELESLNISEQLWTIRYALETLLALPPYEVKP